MGVYIWAFVGVLYLRTKFVNDDWMVEKGFMESTVDEKDKWLGILQRPGLLCFVTHMLICYTHYLTSFLTSPSS